jgi:4-amino-4-deoxy-L-arabinose transferase-like glycosyltransferase
LFIPLPNQRDFYRNSDAERVTSVDIFILLLAITIGSFLRLYNLSIITNGFEGELSPYYAASTSLHGIFRANKGIDGPWAPLGILFYLPVYFSTLLWGSTVFAIRFSSAIVGIATIIILFFSLKKLTNSRIASIASLLFALNSMHIGWSRSDIHPHGVTAWPGLILILCTFNFFLNRSLTNAFFLVLSMGLTWHQYPSGQAQVIIPWLMLLFILLLSESRKEIFKVKKIFGIVTVISIGSLLWYMGLPMSYYLADGKWEFLNPFTLTTQRASWGNLDTKVTLISQITFIAKQSFFYFFDFLNSLVFKAQHIFHQDFVINIPNLYPRTYPIFFVPFLCFGLVISIKNFKAPWAKLLIAFFIASIIPGILSERPYPKRMSVVFLVLDCFSAIGIYTVFHYFITQKPKIRYVIGIFSFVATVFFTCWLSFAWFSGRQYQIGLQPESAVANQIATEIRPSTLLITDIAKDYDEGKLFFLLMDTITNPALRPISVQALNENNQIIKFHWIHHWTKFALYEENIPSEKFNTVIFLFLHRNLSTQAIEDRITERMNRCSQTGSTSKALHFPITGTFSNEMSAVICRKE